MLNTREQVVEGVSEQFEKSKKLKEWIAGGPDYTFLEYEKPYIRKLKGEENHFPRFLTKRFFCSTPIEVSFC